MDEAIGQTVAFLTIMDIAEGLRGEFGAEIDAQPGGATVEAGQVNRAFRLAAGFILKAIVPREQDLPGVRTLVLRCAAESRLSSNGVPGDMAATLLDLEPSLGDSWYCYLALAPKTVVEDLLGGGGTSLSFDRH